MKVTGLNKKEYNLDIKKYIVRNDDSKKKSKYHLLARKLLKEIFTGYTILEEVKLPGSRDPSKKSTLFLDFLIPNAMLGIEVHGQQHYEFSKFFHKSKSGFLTSRRRDDIKEQWCELNGINLVVLKYSDSAARWREQIER